MPSAFRSLPPFLIPLGVLLAVCILALALPFRMIEPDDDDYFYGMHAFARGRVVMTQEQAREVAKIQLPDRTRPQPGGPGGPMAMGIRSPKGFMRERSPGHYALLAFFRWFRLDRLANVVLAFAVVGFFYYFARRHLEQPAEVAVLASLLLILNPTFLTGLYRVYMSDFDYFVWATVSLGLYFMARQTGRLWLCAAAGASLSLSVFFRNTNAISFLAIGAYEALRYWLGLRELAAAGRAALETPNTRCQIASSEQAAAGVSRAPNAEAGGVARSAGEDEDRLKAGLQTKSHRFNGSCVAMVVGGAIVGLIPLAWYGYVTTGQLFGTGYQYRLDRQTSAYFALWDRWALFSLYHLGYTFSVGLPRLLQGYPLILLAPAGLLMMSRRRSRPALFLALWLGLYWGIYLCYSTIREDSFQFMCRKLSPALAPLAIAAAAALARMPRNARYATFAVLTALSLGVTSEFFVRFLGGQRGGPPGPPRIGGPGPGPGAPGSRPGGPGFGPGGPMMRPPLRPPSGRLLQAAAEQLGSDPRAAERALKTLAEFLEDLPPMAPPHAREAAENLLPRLKTLREELRAASGSGKRLAADRQKAIQDELKAIEPLLREALPPPPGGPFGPGEGPPGPLPPEGDFKGFGPPGPGEKAPFGVEGDDPRAIVQRLHGLMDDARRQGIDVSKAEELDEASKAAADRGEWEENRRLLREALETVERALGRPGTAPRPAPPKAGPPFRPKDNRGGGF